ncbi:SET and MYND domain-containing protein 4 [Diachasma alloeum]|uniref:SET and MYND domain-containing protein 4 n=1 Tax=Diachasma alloeum TaxID=454923 RepID=UPI0007382845|nr:SET and MYND domain-containing protein 4 [Diachasma alloeum]XP_015120253.1 SET and MYND domain-containing protein 4 [Diachasma alloeum]
MEKNERNSLGQFHSSIYNAANTELFMREFERHSKAGDRQGMIEMILQLDQVSNTDVSALFTPKNNEEAEKLYNDVNSTDEAARKISNLCKIDLLTKALFAAESDTLLTIKIIVARAKYEFSIRSYQQCCRDCDYAMKLLNNSQSSKLQNEFETEKMKTMCDLLKSQCLKLSKKSSKQSPHTYEKKLPKVDGKPSKKLKTCSDAVALIHEDARGRHLIATRNIKAGSVLIVDEPFSFSTDEAALSTNCLHCHSSLQGNRNIRVPCGNCQTVSFCSEECRKNAWSSYHKYECMIFDNFLERSTTCDQKSHVLLAYRTTIAKAITKNSSLLDAEFLCYQDAKCEDAKKSLAIDIKSDFYDPLDYRTIFSLETHCEKADAKVNLSRSIKSVYLAKCLAFVLMEVDEKNRDTIGQREIVLLAVAMMRHMQAVNCNAYEIVENFRDRNTRTWEPRNVGGAIYSSVSLVNHSCYPNVVRHSYPGGKVVVRSLRFIEKGSELLDCYGPHFITDSLQLRQQYLVEKYHFICTCEPCKSDWKFPFPDEITFRCTSCGNSLDSLRLRCIKCSQKFDIRKLCSQLEKSTKKRIAAVGKMYEGYYIDALPLLLEHSSFLDKTLMAPSLEAIKTQQSIVQCFNSLSNTYNNQFITTDE